MHTFEKMLMTCACILCVPTCFWRLFTVIANLMLVDETAASPCVLCYCIILGGRRFPQIGGGGGVGKTTEKSPTRVYR